MRRSRRVRAAGAVSVSALLIASAALAPYSVTTAFADESSVAAQLQRHQGQGLTAQSAETPEPDSSVPAEDTSGGSAASAGSAGSTGAGDAEPANAEYTLDQFMSAGVVNWGGYKFTYYSEQVLPGPGLEIPGRHVNAAGYVSDSDGYIVLAGDAAKGTVYETPFGYPGKIYDRGTVGNHLDVYIR